MRDAAVCRLLLPVVAGAKDVVEHHPCCHLPADFVHGAELFARDHLGGAQHNQVLLAGDQHPAFCEVGLPHCIALACVVHGHVDIGPLHCNVSLQTVVVALNATSE